MKKAPKTYIIFKKVIEYVVVCAFFISILFLFLSPRGFGEIMSFLAKLINH